VLIKYGKPSYSALSLPRVRTSNPSSHHKSFSCTVSRSHSQKPKFALLNPKRKTEKNMKNLTLSPCSRIQNRQSQNPFSLPLISLTSHSSFIMNQPRFQSNLMFKSSPSITISVGSILSDQDLMYHIRV